MSRTRARCHPRAGRADVGDPPGALPPLLVSQERRPRRRAGKGLGGAPMAGVGGGRQETEGQAVAGRQGPGRGACGAGWTLEPGEKSLAEQGQLGGLPASGGGRSPGKGSGPAPASPTSAPAPRLPSNQGLEAAQCAMISRGLNKSGHRVPPEREEETGSRNPRGFTPCCSSWNWQQALNNRSSGQHLSPASGGAQWPLQVSGRGGVCVWPTVLQASLGPAGDLPRAGRTPGFLCDRG